MAKFNYYQSKSRGSFGRIIFLVVIVLLVYFLGGVLISPFAGPVSFALQPAWWVSAGWGEIEQAVIDWFRNQNKLAISNRQLLEENTKLKSVVLVKNQVEADNAYLRQIFGRSEKKVVPLVGQVIFSPNFVPAQTLLIDLGKNNLKRSLKVGDFATLYHSIIIGRVAEVGDNFSKVRLLSTEDNLAVTIGAKNIPAVAKGAGAGNFEIILPKDALVAIGDRVVAPLLDNLLIGVVRFIEKKPNSPNQTILVKTPVNLWQLKWLEFYDAKN